MTTNLSNIRWQLIKSALIDKKDKKDNYLINLGFAITQKLIRVEIKSDNYQPDFYYSAGFLSATTKILMTDACVFNQQVLFGNNIILFPYNFEKYERILFKPHYYLKGKIRINFYKTSQQIIINPITQQPIAV